MHVRETYPGTSYIDCGYTFTMCDQIFLIWTEQTQDAN